VGALVRSGNHRPSPETVPINTALGLLAVCLLILASAVFVAAEFALVAADRNRIEQRAAGGSRSAGTALGLLRRLSFHLSGAQLGITLVSLVLGFIAEPVIAQLIEPLVEPIAGGASTTVSIILALFLATIAQMVLGELIPKGLAIAAPETAAILLAPFVRIYGIIFGPVISFLNGAANATVRRLGIEPQEELSHVRTLRELSLVIRASAEGGTIAGSASDLLTRSIRFGEKTAADVLVPRVEVRALASDATVADLVASSVETGHSRVPIYGADLDDIVGVVHVKVAQAVAVGDRSGVPLASVMAPITAIPETRGLDDVLSDMRVSRSHLVVAVDEYGGTAGILTLEDVIEEIVGEIDDEYDALTPPPATDTEAGELVVSGSLHADELFDATGFEMPEGDYETLAGFVLDQLGSIPDVGEVVTYEGWRLEVDAVDRRRVARVRLRRPDHDAADAALLLPVEGDDRPRRRPPADPTGPGPGGGASA
jgi:CBS domain containing-hemolysin-like protein